MIRLDLSDINFMLSTLSLSDRQSELLNLLAAKEEKLISEKVAGELRDLCGDRLITYGFDRDYNPREDGSKLEYLIDKLFTD